MNKIVKKISSLVFILKIIKILVMTILLILTIFILALYPKHKEFEDCIFFASLILMFGSLLYEKKGNLFLQLVMSAFFIFTMFFWINYSEVKTNSGELIMAIVAVICVLSYFFWKLIIATKIYKLLKPRNNFYLSNEEKNRLIREYCKKHNLNPNIHEFEFIDVNELKHHKKK